MVALRRVAAPLGGAAAAVALLLAGRGLDDVAAPGQLGPGFWPRLVLVGLGIACVAHALTAWRRQAAGWGGEPAEAVSRARLVAAIVVVLLYVLVTPVVGWALATALFMAVFMPLAGARRGVVVAGCAAAGTVGLLYLFVKVVYLPLPKGDGVFETVTLALYRGLGIF